MCIDSWVFDYIDIKGATIIEKWVIVVACFSPQSIDILTREITPLIGSRKTRYIVADITMLMVRLVVETSDTCLQW